MDKRLYEIFEQMKKFKTPLSVTPLEDPHCVVIDAFIKEINFGEHEIVLICPEKKFSEEYYRILVKTKNRNLEFKGKSRRVFGKLNFVKILEDYEFNDLRKDRRFQVIKDHNVDVQTLKAKDVPEFLQKAKIVNLSLQGAMIYFDESLTEAVKEIRKMAPFKLNFIDIAGSPIELKAQLKDSGVFEGEDEKLIPFMCFQFKGKFPLEKIDEASLKL